MSGKASNAILAKTRSKFGQRLTEKNYRDMVSLSSLSELLAYLKSNTRYGAPLSSVRETDLHRDKLERWLLSAILLETRELCLFEKTIGDHLFQYVIAQAEVNALTDFVRLLATGHPESYPELLSPTLQELSSIDFTRLFQVKTFWQLVEVLRDTKYGKVFSSFPASPTGVPDLLMIEATLDNVLYHDTFEMLEDGFSDATGEELRAILELQGELLNIRRLYRAKQYYQVSSDILRAQMLRVQCHLNRTHLQQLLEAENGQAILDVLKTTWYGRFIGRYAPENIDHFADCVLADRCVSRIRLSPRPSVVMLCYILFLRDELENLTNIIEGIRYGVPSAEISQLLIPLEKEGGS